MGCLRAKRSQIEGNGSLKGDLRSCEVRGQETCAQQNEWISAVINRRYSAGLLNLRARGRVTG